jgi:hypothetical protein
VGVKQDIASAKVYMARTNRRIEKQRYLIGRSRNAHTVATARDLVEVLTALLANVEHRHQYLQARRGSSLRLAGEFIARRCGAG